MSWWAKRPKSSRAAASSWLCNRARNSEKESDMVRAHRVSVPRTAGAAPRIFFADSGSGTDLFRRSPALPGKRRNRRSPWGSSPPWLPPTRHRGLQHCTASFPIRKGRRDKDQGQRGERACVGLARNGRAGYLLRSCVPAPGATVLVFPYPRGFSHGHVVDETNAEAEVLPGEQ